MDKKNLYILIGIVVLLLVLSVSAFAFIGTSSKNVIKKTTNGTIDYVGNTIEKANKEMKEMKDKNVSVDMNAKLNLDLSDNILTSDEYKNIQKKLNDSTINYKLTLDQKNEIIQLFLGLTLKEKKLIDLELDLTDDEAYLKLKDVIDDYLKLDLDEESNISFDTVNVYEDVEVIYDELSPVLKKEILKGKITSSKETLNIDGKDVKVKKNTLTVDEKLYLTTENAILKKVQENEKVQDSIINISKLTDQEITKEDLLEDIKDEIEYNEKEIEKLKEDKDADQDEFYFVVYTKGILSKPVQYKLVNSEDEIELVLTVKDKSQYSLKMNEIDEEILSVEGTFKEENCDLTYKMTSEDGSFTGKLVITTEKKTKDGQKGHLEFTIDTGKDLIGSVGINSDINVTYADNVASPDFSKAITQEQLSEDVITKAIAKLQEILDAFEINITAEDTLMGLSTLGSDLPEYDDNYDYDDEYDDSEFDPYGDGYMFNSDEY